MAKHPNKQYEDNDEAKLDSTKHHEERRAKIQAETAEKKEVDEAEATRIVENQEIAHFKGLSREGETREQLLDRIRKLREEPPKEVEPEGHRSEGLLKTFNAEQEAGRAAVAKAEAELELFQSIRQQNAVEGEKK